MHIPPYNPEAPFSPCAQDAARIAPAHDEYDVCEVEGVDEFQDLRRSLLVAECKSKILQERLELYQKQSLCFMAGWLWCIYWIIRITITLLCVIGGIILIANYSSSDEPHD